MAAYKLKAINDEYNILNLSLRIQNRNSYPREENNYGDDSITFLIDDGKVCKTDITKKTDLTSNKIPENTYSILSYLHIGDEKYRI